MSQTGLRGLFAAFTGAVESLHRYGGEFLTESHFRKAGNRDLSSEDAAEGITCGCGGTFIFSRKAKTAFVKLDAIPVRGLHLCREKACAKSEETGTALFVEGALYNVADKKYTIARETALYETSLRTQTKYLQLSSLEARGLKMVAI